MCSSINSVDSYRELPSRADDNYTKLKEAHNNLLESFHEKDDHYKAVIDKLNKDIDYFIDDNKNSKQKYEAIIMKLNSEIIELTEKDKYNQDAIYRLNENLYEFTDKQDQHKDSMNEFQNIIARLTEKEAKYKNIIKKLNDDIEAYQNKLNQDISPSVKDIDTDRNNQLTLPHTLPCISFNDLSEYFKLNISQFTGFKLSFVELKYLSMKLSECNQDQCELNSELASIEDSCIDKENHLKKQLKDTKHKIKKLSLQIKQLKTLKTGGSISADNNEGNATNNEIAVLLRDLQSYQDHFDELSRYLDNEVYLDPHLQQKRSDLREELNVVQAEYSMHKQSFQQQMMVIQDQLRQLLTRVTDEHVDQADNVLTEVSIIEIIQKLIDSHAVPPQDSRNDNCVTDGSDNQITAKINGKLKAFNCFDDFDELILKPIIVQDIHSYSVSGPYSVSGRNPSAIVSGRRKVQEGRDITHELVHKINLKINNYLDNNEGNRKFSVAVDESSRIQTPITTESIALFVNLYLQSIHSSVRSNVISSQFKLLSTQLDTKMNEINDILTVLKNERLDNANKQDQMRLESDNKIDFLLQQLKQAEIKINQVISTSQQKT